MAVVRDILARIAVPAGALGLIGVLAALVVYVSEGGLTVPGRILLVLGGLGLLIFVWGNPRAIGGFATSRTTRYGSLSLIITAAFLGILVLANFLATRHSPRWDLTQAKLYSLAPQTKQLLGRLDSPVQALAFVPADDARKQRAEDLLHEYSAISPKFTYQIIDPDQNPSQATRYGIRNYGDVVFIGNNLTQTVTVIDESNFTSALLKLQSRAVQTVYFLTGHGERSIDNFGDTDYSKAKTALQRDNYIVKPLSLITATTVPTDAAALILGQPKQAFLPQELDQIQIYLGHGGSLLLMMDYNSPNPVSSILPEWGVETRDGAVVDPSTAFFGDPTTLVVQGDGYLFSDITRDLGASVFPLATMISPTQNITRGVVSRSILQSSQQSWLETNKQKVEFNANEDLRGPISIAVASEANAPSATSSSDANAAQSEDAIKKQPKTRVVVFGDADFVSNAIIDRAPGNQDLFLNSVHWLTQSSDLVSIRPKPPVERSMIITGPQRLWLFLSSTVLLPGIVFIAGALVWWGRR